MMADSNDLFNYFGFDTIINETSTLGSFDLEPIYTIEQTTMNSFEIATEYINENSINSRDSITKIVQTYDSEEHRLTTFEFWKNQSVCNKKLAHFGFYYISKKDYVRCNFCKVVIGDWGIGDDPFIEHKIHSPQCIFINMKETYNNYSEQTVNANQALSELTQMENSDGSLNIYRVQSPRHPFYADFVKRKESFENWPKSLTPTPDDLSVAGFFYLGVSDEVKCFHCGGCLKDWEPNETALSEHKRHFETKCGFIRLNYEKLKKRIPTKSRSKELVKATPCQIKALIDYMNQNTDLRDGKLHLAPNKNIYKDKWENIADILNNLYGPKKTIQEWQEMWRNHKYNKKRISNKTTTDVEDREQNQTIHTAIQLNETEMQPDLLNQTGFIQERADGCFTISQNTRCETIHDTLEIPAEHKSTANHQEAALNLNDNGSLPKASPIKRKLGECSTGNERENKYQALEIEKLHLKIGQQQLEIERLKMKLEFAETKQQLEKEKDELEKEKNRIALERTSIFIPIQSNFE